MALTEAQHRRRSSSSSSAAAAAAAMAGGVDTTPMPPGPHSDEAAPAPMSPVLHYSAGGVSAPRPQPNLRDGGLSPHWGGDRQRGDEFRSGGSGRGNPRQCLPSRGRGRRGQNTRGGHRGFHLPAISSKPAEDVELSQESAVLKETAPAEVQQATPAEVQQATPAEDVELSRKPTALKEAAPAEVQQAPLAEVQKATPATMALTSKSAQDVELSREPAALKEAAPAEVQQATLAEVQKATPAQDVELSRKPTALKEAAPAEVQQAPLAEVQKAIPATMATPDGRSSFWCDICWVSCFSLVTLEAHKNGKRHQKTKLGLERFEAQQKLMAGVQEPPQMALGEANIDAQMSIPLPPKEATLSEELPKEATLSEELPKEATLSEELPKEATLSEVPPEKLIVETDNGSRGIKRKKPSEPVRVCTLCNAMCETILTFQAHLGSMKHTGRIKRQKGPDMEYGCVPVPISLDQPAAGAATTEAAENIYFGLARRDTLLQQGNGYGGMVAEISPHQQAVESVQVKDELPEPQAVESVQVMAGVQEPMHQMALCEANIDARVSIPPLPKEATLSAELPIEATSNEVPPEKLIVETDNGSKGIKRKKPSEPVRVCTLCNAMCESIPTFQAHLGSKKHMARIKHQKGPDMEYGCVPVPISSDQPAAGAGTTETAENIFFGLARRDTLLQQGNGL